MAHAYCISPQQSVTSEVIAMMTSARLPILRTQTEVPYVTRTSRKLLARFALDNAGLVARSHPNNAGFNVLLVLFVVRPLWVPASGKI